MTCNLIAFALSILTVETTQVQASPEHGGAKALDLVEITTRSMDASWMMFLEHDGPYWTAGQVVGRVRSYMLGHGYRGAVLIRYPSDPTRGISQGSSCRVGFLIPQSQEKLDAPWKTDTLPAERVALMTLEGRPSNPRKDYARLRAWVRGKELVAAGPLTEVLVFSTKDGRAALARTEIRLALRGPPAPTPSRHPHKEQPDVRHSPQPPVIARAPASTPSDVARDKPKQAAPVQATAKREPTRAIPLPPSTRITVQEPESDALTVMEESEVGSTASIAELARMEKYDRVAKRMIPDDLKIAPAQQLWLGRVAFRIGAVARGVGQRGSVGAGKVEKLGLAIERRFQVYSKGSTLDPLSASAMRVETQRGSAESTRRAIMRELDGLLGLIALRSLSEGEIFHRLVEIINGVRLEFHGAVIDRE